MCQCHWPRFRAQRLRPGRSPPEIWSFLKTVGPVWSMHAIRFGRLFKQMLRYIKAPITLTMLILIPPFLPSKSPTTARPSKCGTLRARSTQQPCSMRILRVLWGAAILDYDLPRDLKALSSSPSVAALRDAFVALPRPCRASNAFRDGLEAHQTELLLKNL